VNTAIYLTSFDEVNQYLRQFHDSAKTKYSLHNMLSLMDFLNNPQEKFKTIHVAGTSGKTSTSYFVAALLLASGHKTGLTVSPHVDEINERVQINGVPLKESEFCHSISIFLDVIEKAPIKPSWFELMVAFAYWYFAEEKVEYAVVEVGLGGLKDGTNVINRPDKVCIITDIGYDHMAVLGKTLSKIAEQKAGIIRPGNKIFSYKQSDEVMNSIKKSADQNKADLVLVKETVNLDLSVPNYQYRNWWLAYNAFLYISKKDRLGTLSDNVTELSRHVLVPGRMDISKVGLKTVVMDGAHNVQKMSAFVDSFKDLFPGIKPAVLIALRSGKEYKLVAPIISSFATRVITTSFSTTQDLPILSVLAEDLALAFESSARVEAISDPKLAYQKLLNDESSVVVVTGSFYLLGEIRKDKLHD
jgi:dihydrofolate synthase/folylpolyglutamate synthase